VKLEFEKITKALVTDSIIGVDFFSPSIVIVVCMELKGLVLITPNFTNPELRDT
jgi:hypothetical protein